MVALCTNRFEGFGPHSSIHPSTPTQCFNDVILVPLATWIYLAILLILAPLEIFILSDVFPSRTSRVKPSTGPRKPPWRHAIGQRSLVGLYCLLIVGMLALISVEIARLTAAQLGIGLLPFGYVGVLTALFVHIVTTQTPGDEFPVKGRSKRSWRLRGVTALFWILMAAMTAVAAAAAKSEENSGYVRTGQQAMYPVDDVFVDNLTMACLGVVLAGLEFLTS